MVLIILFSVASEYIVVNYIIVNSSYEQYRKNFHLNKKKGVVVGDSRVANGIVDTDKFANIGYAGDNLNSSLMKLKYITNKLKKTYIIVQLDPHFLAHYRLESNQESMLDDLLNYENETTEIQFMRAPYRRYLLQMWKTIVTNPSKIFKKPVDGAVKKHEIIKLTDKNPSSINKEAKLRIQYQVPLPGFSNLKILSEFEEYLKELRNSSKLCLATFPVSSYYRNEANKYKEITMAINKFSNIGKRTNIKYIDLWDRYEDSYFADVDHLNYNGAKILTKQLVYECFNEKI